MVCRRRSIAQHSIRNSCDTPRAWGSITAGALICKAGALICLASSFKFRDPAQKTIRHGFSWILHPNCARRIDYTVQHCFFLL
jgi:hypothetical protein